MYGMSLAPAPIAIFHFAVAIAIAATSAIVHLFASSAPAIIEPHAILGSQAAKSSIAIAFIPAASA